MSCCRSIFLIISSMELVRAHEFYADMPYFFYQLESDDNQQSPVYSFMNPLCAASAQAFDTTQIINEENANRAAYWVRQHAMSNLGSRLYARVRIGVFWDRRGADGASSVSHQYSIGSRMTSFSFSSPFFDFSGCIQSAVTSLILQKINNS